MTTTPQSSDPFDVLGLAPSFDLTHQEVERAYLAQAAGLHPDLGGASVGSDDLERETARLNAARATLRDAERRAGALLARLGGPSASEDRSLPDGFLMEILEIRERVEAAAGSGDPEQIARWEAWAAEERARYTREVSARFAQLGETPDASDLGAIRTQLNAWRYIERLIEQLDPDYDPARADFGGGG
ncbi:MAG: iron-sulfur cluster co-chaperone HscB C-terminal domain-containing protein [Phycisphaerales bacterium JB059]